MTPAVGAGVVTIRALSTLKDLRSKGRRNAEGRGREAAPAGAARALPGALAHRRSTTVLARGTADPKGSAPGQASWDVICVGVTHHPLSQSSGSTPRTGRSAGQHDARSRPRVAVTSRHARAPHPAFARRGHRLTSFTTSGIALRYSNRKCEVKAFLFVQTKRALAQCAFSVPHAHSILDSHESENYENKSTSY